MSGVVRCTYCNLIGKFVLNSATYQCDCIDGFQVTGNICTDICGDGRFFTAECDDGNTQAGDGCSSQLLLKLATDVLVR